MSAITPFTPDSGVCLLRSGLVSYGTNFDDLFRRWAVYADTILKGGKPAELPIEQATKFEPVLDLRTGNTLGLTIPTSLLLQADEVIE